jgi:gamma-glutamyltranspeptidase / glutathione hydrolase
MSGSARPTRYADERRADIGPGATPAAALRAGLPPPEGQHTTHLDIVDEHGAAIALTTTINDLYGSGVTVKGGGFLLNNEMDDFTIRPRRAESLRSRAGRGERHRAR